VIDEPESAALELWLSGRVDRSFTSSELAKVEVLRSIRRLDSDALPAARALIGDLHLIPLSGRVVDEAAALGEPLLRSLDALHLASALSIATELTAFVAYDRRLMTAAAAASLVTVQPGALISKSDNQ
jgi:uncharacterized protein